MPLDTKWKFAILAGISECLVFAEAKYCAFEIHGDVKYYGCPRTEYCCNFGCCVSPGFQIYHLWYYWLLVIIMFLVCSGGGWWYRYWLQGRYRAGGASTLPHRPYNSRAQNSLRSSTCQAQQARISYNSARNTVLLHRMWKGPHRDVNSPAYNTAASSTHYQSTSVVVSDNDCPYYQLYGPPPSYETVIAQTRGKFPTLMSAEQTRLMLQSSTPNHCFAHPYASPLRINENPEIHMPLQNNAVGSTIRPAEVSGYPNCTPHCLNTNGSSRSDAMCTNHCDNSFQMYKDSYDRLATFKDFTGAESVPQVENVNAEGQAIVGISCASGCKNTDREKRSPPKLASETKVHGRSKSTRPSRSRSSQNLKKEDERKDQRGSLRLFKSLDQKYIHSRLFDVASGYPKSSLRPAPQGINDRAAGPEVASSAVSSSQSNPSNNVILAPPTSNVVIDMSATSISENDADERRLLLSAMQGSTNSNLESNSKLDRSRSLE